MVNPHTQTFSLMLISKSTKEISQIGAAACKPGPVFMKNLSAKSCS